MKNIVTIFLVLLPRLIIGQQGVFSPTDVVTQTGFYLSTSRQTPYLNRTNQYGLAPVEAQTWFLNAAVHRKYDSTYTENKKLHPWGYSYGFEAHANLGGKNSLLLPTAHISGRYKGVELYIGRKREYLGLADTTGTWGSYIWSGNALPLPKIQISTPHYVPLAGQGFLSAKLGLSHGWFGKQHYTEKYYLHQKWLYLKIGRETQRLNLIGGLNQNVQWGGYSETLKDDDLFTVNGHFASDLFTYLNVVLPLKIWKRPDNKYSPAEREYRFGNHLGTLDLGVKMKTAQGTISMYRQTPWKDGQIPEVFFSWDGNYTLIYDLKEPASVRKISIEIFTTQRQGYEITWLARFFGLKERHPDELQSYLNHGQYLDGWSYEKRGIGSIAIVPHEELKEEARVENYLRFTRDNKVIAPAFTVAGKIQNISYSLHGGYIISEGTLTNERPEKLSQFSTRITGAFPLLKYDLYGKIDVGLDLGNLYGNQAGVNLTVYKHWK